MILDSLRPYFAAIRIVAYMLLTAFIFVSGCNYGKHKQTVAVNDLKNSLSICKDANKASQESIKTLQGINAEYASQGAKQAEKVAQAVKDAKAAEKRAQALAGAAPYQIDTVIADHWLPLLAEIEQDISIPRSRGVLRIIRREEVFS